MTHLSSRDMCLGLYFLTMIIVPSVGVMISAANGNPTINAWHAASPELCGYLYLEMCFKILVIILPGWLARYEQNYTSESLREKESFITQVAVETRTPLTNALEQIKGKRNSIIN